MILKADCHHNTICYGIASDRLMLLLYWMLLRVRYNFLLLIIALIFFSKSNAIRFLILKLNECFFDDKDSLIIVYHYSLDILNWLNSLLNIHFLTMFGWIRFEKSNVKIQQNIILDIETKTNVSTNYCRSKNYSIVKMQLFIFLNSDWFLLFFIWLIIFGTFWLISDWLLIFYFCSD